MFNGPKGQESLYFTVMKYRKTALHMHILNVYDTLYVFQVDLLVSNDIMKTHLYNFDPLKPHFYIVKLGFTGVYIIFLISAQNID